MVDYAYALTRIRPDVELILARDPDFMPYGLLEPAQIAERIVSVASACARHDPDAIVIACNTGSMYALESARARFEPDTPIVGVVPAIRPAGATGRPFAVWATAAATVSDYQTGLISRFASPDRAHRIACYGLAEAIDSGDPGLVDAAIARAALATPVDIESVVLGCTHYGLVADRIVAALTERTGRRPAVFDSPEPVARQVLRRLDIPPGGSGPDGAVVAVVESGRPGVLPERLGIYPAGRELLNRCRPGLRAALRNDRDPAEKKP